MYKRNLEPPVRPESKEATGTTGVMVNRTGTYWKDHSLDK